MRWPMPDKPSPDSAGVRPMRDVDGCPICASNGVFHCRGRAGSLGYAGCNICGHRWLVKIPAAVDLDAYYNTSYQIEQESYSRTAQREFPFVSGIIAAEGVARGRMLEIGCSYGDVLSFFRDAGWMVEGVELDARAAEYARTHFGLSVRAGALSAIVEDECEPFDCVTAFHVIEHILDPAEFLRAIHSITKPGAVLLMKTPNVASLAAASPAGSWEWYLSPEHVHLFSPDSLTRILQQNGFQVARAFSRRGDANSTLFELAKGIGRHLSRRDAGSQAPSKRARPKGKLFDFTRRTLNALGAPLDALIGIGDSIGRPVRPELVVLARRSSS